jgi:hypothetical protein
VFYDHSLTGKLSIFSFIFGTKLTASGFLFGQPTVEVHLLYPLITFVVQTFRVRVEVDTGGLKEFEIMPPSLAKKRADHTSSRLLNHLLTFESVSFLLARVEGALTAQRLAQSKFRSHP